MNIQSKKKQLIKNTGIIGIGTILSKLFTFLLLPLYTAYLTTSEYGYIDLLQTIANLLIPILSLELYCAVFRFIIEEKDEKARNKIIGTSFFINAGVVVLFLLVIAVLTVFFNFKNPVVFSVYFVSLMIFTSLQSTIRGYGNNKFFSIVSFFNTALALILNIVFIIVLKYNALSILYAFSISNTLAIIIILIRMPLLKAIKLANSDKKIANKMIKYSLPLIPNEISWWVANTSDRLIISKVIGLSANGIYAVANKIPVIYTALFGIFNTAWVEAVSRGIEDDNSEEFINDMYKKCFKLFSCMCIGIICTMSVLFNILIGKDYIDSYIHIYILMIAIFFNSLSSLIGSILTGYKETKIIGGTTIIGAVVNLIINILLIKCMGLYAASLSTLISYIVIFIARNIRVNKIIKLEYPIKYILILLVNLIAVSIGYIYKIKILNIALIIYLVIFSIVVNKDLLHDIITMRKKNDM